MDGDAVEDDEQGTDGSEGRPEVTQDVERGDGFVLLETIVIVWSAVALGGRHGCFVGICGHDIRAIGITVKDGIGRAVGGVGSGSSGSGSIDFPIQVDD